MTVRWTGDDAVRRNMQVYGDKVTFAVRQVALYWQKPIEDYAKIHAPWIDQTANARQSLHAYVEDVSRGVVNLYLSHGVEYGIYLETRSSGKYAILWKTLKAHLPRIMQMLREIFN